MKHYKTSRLLEFGGGSMIMPLINVFAVRQPDNICSLYNYLESERKEIELWKHRKEGTHD